LGNIIDLKVFWESVSVFGKLWFFRILEVQKKSSYLK